VFIELSKLGPILEKDARDMEPLEAWSVFFANAHKPEYKSLIAALSDVKKEVNMANNLLMSISQDEIQQAHYRSRRIFERDMEHNYAVSRKEGRAEGLSEAARGFKAKGVDPQAIAEVTGLSLDEVLSL
jgi:predicted transposase/invertase (TIGR01784 family)